MKRLSMLYRLAMTTRVSVLSAPTFGEGPVVRKLMGGAGYAGVMSVTYTNQNSYGHFTASKNGVSADLKATVTLRTPDQPTDPLFVEQRYLTDANVVPVWQDYSGKGVQATAGDVRSVPNGQFERRKAA